MSAIINGVPVLTARQAAQDLGITTHRVRQLLEQGRLDVIRDAFGAGRNAYLVASVEDYKRTRKPAGNPNWLPGKPQPRAQK